MGEYTGQGRPLDDVTQVREPPYFQYLSTVLFKVTYPDDISVFDEE